MHYPSPSPSKYTLGPDFVDGDTETFVSGSLGLICLTHAAATWVVELEVKRNNVISALWYVYVHVAKAIVISISFFCDSTFAIP